MTADRAGQQRLARTLVLAALRDPLSVPALPPPDLDLTLRLMRRLRLLGRLAWQLRAAGVLDSLPDVVTDQLLSALVLCESRVRSARWELDRVAWALRDRGEVPLVALKGCAYLLACTPNSLGRTFADVDLLVPEDHLPSVEKRLRDYGWAGKEVTPYDDLYYRRWAHELPPMLHAEREVEVDLHHGILMRTARLKPSPVLLFESAREVQGSPYKVLAPADMVLHAIVHLFHGGEMDDALRDLVDIDELLRHFGATEAGFWSTFWGRAEALDLARPAYYGLRYARGDPGYPDPSERGGPGSRWSAVSGRPVADGSLGATSAVPATPGSSGRARRAATAAAIHALSLGQDAAGDACAAPRPQVVYAIRSPTRWGRGGAWVGRVLGRS